MQNPNKPNDEQSGNENKIIQYHRVNANHGSLWLMQGYKLVRSSIGPWFGIATLLIILLSMQGINTIAALLMPIGIGGLMLGCHQKSGNRLLKIGHLFAGIKSDGKELLVLSLIYALASITIIIASRYILLLGGIDVAAVLPENVAQMTNEQLFDWMRNKELSDLSPVFLNSLISLLLMIPLIMAYWFAPALIVLKKMSAVNAMKLSFIVCRTNLRAFLVYGLLAFSYLILFMLLVSIVAVIIPPLAVIAIMLGVLAIIAISIASIYTAYVDIFDSQIETLDENAKDKDSSMIA